MTWKSTYRPPFKRITTVQQRKEAFTLESELDFPTLDNTSFETSNVSDLSYNHINNLAPNEEHTFDNKKDGWLYLSIEPTTNKVCWEDYSYGSFNIVEAQAQEKVEAFIEEWCHNFELEKEEFIENYGYDEYKKHYYISEELTGDDESSDDGMDMMYDEYGDYSDEDYV